MKGVFLHSLLMISLVLISHFIFDRLNLYDEFVWLDIPMHLFGGFFIGGIIFSYMRFKKMQLTLALPLLIFIFVASLWEFNEFFVRGVVRHDWYGLLDTIKDYFDGMLGVVFSYLYYKKH